MLRPEGLLALHRQGRLLPSFRLRGRPQETSGMTTWAHSQLPWPDLHRLDTRPHGLQTEARRHREEGTRGPQAEFISNRLAESPSDASRAWSAPRLCASVVS